MKIYFYFFRGPGGHYIKSRVHISSQWRHIQQLLKKGLKNAYLWLFEGPWEGPSVIRLGVSCSQVSSHPYLCTCEIRKQSDKYFLSSNPKYENKNHFSIHIKLKVTKYSGSKTLSQSRQMYNKGKITSCSYMGPNVILLGILGYSAGGIGGGGGGGLGDPILLTSYPLTYINLHITYGSKSIQDFVSYRVHKLLSNDN